MLSMPVTPNYKIDLTDLTHSVVGGNGVFDQLMKAVSAHLEQEFQKGRIKGTEYSTVYLSAMQGVLDTSLQFVLSKEKANKEIELIEQQKTNLALEAANIPKQGVLLDVQAQVQTQQKENLIAEEAGILARNALTVVQTTNAGKEGLVLDKQVDKVLAETELLNQRKVTETAQTSAGVAASGSVLGKQIEVLTNQASGFIRDAEQKAAEIMVRGFSVVATTNDLEEAQADTYGISNTNVSAVLAKLKTGVGA